MSSFGLNTQSLSSIIRQKPNGALFGVDLTTSVFATQAGEFGGWNPNTMPLEDSPVIQTLAQGFSALSLVAQPLNAEELPNLLENGLDTLTFDQGGRKEQQVLDRLERQLVALQAQTPEGSDAKEAIQRHLQTINAYQKGLKINEYASKRATSLILTELNKERQVASVLRNNETHPLIYQLSNAELQRRGLVVEAFGVLAKTAEIGLQAATLPMDDPNQAAVEAAYIQLGQTYDQLEAQRFEAEQGMQALAQSIDPQGEALTANLPLLGRVTRMAAHIALLDELDDVETQQITLQSLSNTSLGLGTESSLAQSLQKDHDVLTEWLENDKTLDSAIDRSPDDLKSLQLGLLDTERRSQYFTVARLRNFASQIASALMGVTPDSEDYLALQTQHALLDEQLGQAAQQVNQLYLQEQSLIGQFGSWMG